MVRFTSPPRVALLPGKEPLIKYMTHRWAKNAERMEEINAYKILVGKPEGKRQLGRPGRGWKILEWILEKWGGKC
jgi:hypothetical protein